MMRPIGPTVLLAMAPAALACTMFAASDGKLCLAGNNEDWSDPETYAWFKPGTEGEHGRVLFGFGNKWPQGGVNDRGLMFDGAATAHLAQTEGAGKPRFPIDILDRVMRECATVDEAVAMLDRYHMPFMDRAMLFFADRNGDSVIYEGDETLAGDGRHQVLTNYYQSRRSAAEAGCGRMLAAERIFAERFPQGTELTVELMRDVLDASHQEGKFGTKYSQVYDLTNGVIHLYLNHDFSNPIVIDVDDALGNGAREVRLSALVVDAQQTEPERRDDE
jgi:hypothetical protein